MSELNGQPDKVDVGDSPDPGWGERLDQLAFDCRMSLDYLQGYSNLFLHWRLSIGLISCDWVGKVSVLVLFWHLQLVTSLAR